jgi:hypothetical protein
VLCCSLYGWNIGKGACYGEGAVCWDYLDMKPVAGSKVLVVCSLSQVGRDTMLTQKQVVALVSSIPVQASIYVL